MNDIPPPIPPLLLGEKDAARALGLSPRSLFNLRQHEGLPFLKIGTRVMYSPAALAQWVAKRQAPAEMGAR
jgi:hypothetical protein